MADAENAAVYDGNGETAEPSEVTEEASSENNDSDAHEEEKSEEDEDKAPPATLIHLDGAVDIIDQGDMFVLIVGKSMFSSFRRRFSEEELEKTRHKLAAVMGIRYKVAD